MKEQIEMFSCTDFSSFIKPKIRLIELFAGYGSQAMALKNIGVDFEHHFVCEFDKFAIKSYNAIHGTDFGVSNICDIHSSDLCIKDVESFTYLLTYLLVPLHRFVDRRKTTGDGKRKWN